MSYSIVDFNTKTWNDPWVRKLRPEAKLLFIYLWTNNHKNLAGLYSLDIETMSFETGIEIEQIRKSLEMLYPKVKYDDKNEIVWIINHVRHQFMKRSDNISPTVLKKILKDLRTLPEDHYFKEEFKERYPNVPIEDLDIVSKYSIGKGKGKGKGAGNGKDEEGEDFSSYSSDISDKDESSSPSWEEIVKKKI